MSALDLSDLDYLLPKTKQVLLSLSNFEFLNRFTFVEGSGLSLYLHHRLSEDIDLFTWEQSLDLELILPTLQTNFKNLRINQSSVQQLDLVIDQVKVTFFANNWDALKDNQTFHNHLQVASLKLLAGMKLNTLFLRAKYRDYYDLYCINHSSFDVEKLYEIIFNLMPGMNMRLFQMALTYTDDIVDDNIQHLEPRFKISKSQISQHFQKQILDWINKIK